MTVKRPPTIEDPLLQDTYSDRKEPLLYDGQDRINVGHLVGR